MSGISSGVTESLTSLRRATGEPWYFQFGRSYQGTPTDMTAWSVDSFVQSGDTKIEIDTEIGADDDATGYFWVDRAGGVVTLKIKTGDVAGIANRSKLFLRYILPNGEPHTEAIFPLEVIPT